MLHGADGRGPVAERVGELCLLLRLMLLWMGVIAASQASEPLEIECRGLGQSLVLVGGGPAFTTWNLAPIQERLGARFRVCRWDMRGVGDNAGLPLEGEAAVLDQWLADMRRVVPARPAVLWGHSWGALQVLLFAKSNPERVDRLILSNPVDPALGSLTRIEDKRHVHPGAVPALSLDEIATPAEGLHQLRAKLASYFLDGELGWRYAQGFAKTDSNGALNVRVWEEYRRAPLTDADVRDLAPKIAGIVYCRQDVLQPEALTEYRRLLPATRHLVLDGCAHFPWVEQPGAYFEALEGLLRAPDRTE